MNGNPQLQHTRINNLDARYEFFPKGLDEFMAGVFYKNIVDPIEYALVQTNVNGQELQRGNFGIELVYIHYFGQFGLSGNYTYTHSRISSDKGLYYRDSSSGELTTVSVSQARPLQGQSAQIGNMSLLYKDVSSGWKAQLALVYTGSRIAQLSLYRDLDYWQKGDAQLDCSVEKTIGGKWTLFSKLNNLLNLPYELEIKQPNPFRTGMAMLPFQTSNNSIQVQKDQYEPSYLLGLRYQF